MGRWLGTPGGWRAEWKKIEESEFEGMKDLDVFQENMSQVLYLLVTDLVFFNTYKKKCCLPWQNSLTILKARFTSVFTHTLEYVYSV